MFEDDKVATLVTVFIHGTGGVVFEANNNGIHVNVLVYFLFDRPEG